MNQRHRDAVGLGLCGNYAVIHRSCTLTSDWLHTIVFVEFTIGFLGYGLCNGSWKTECSNHQKTEKENAHSSPHWPNCTFSEIRLRPARLRDRSHADGIVPREQRFRAWQLIFRLCKKSGASARKRLALCCGA